MNKEETIKELNSYITKYSKMFSRCETEMERLDESESDEALLLEGESLTLEMVVDDLRDLMEEMKGE